MLCPCTRRRQRACLWIVRTHLFTSPRARCRPALQDGRLNRVLETAVLIMEAFQGFQHKYEYTIVGHSGDSDKIPLVAYGAPPAHQRARLQVLERMVAHAQVCRRSL
jgi:hypothetical protein